MSISRGRFVAVFRKHKHDWFGKYVSRYHAWDDWQVIVKRRNGFQIDRISSRYNQVFWTFAEARKWAIDRLNELTEGT